MFHVKRRRSWLRARHQCRCRAPVIPYPLWRHLRPRRWCGWPLLSGRRADVLQPPRYRFDPRPQHRTAYFLRGQPTTDSLTTPRQRATRPPQASTGAPSNVPPDRSRPAVRPRSTRPHLRAIFGRQGPARSNAANRCVLRPVSTLPCHRFCLPSTIKNDRRRHPVRPQRLPARRGPWSRPAMPCQLMGPTS